MKNLNKNKIISLTKITEPFLMVDNIKNILNLKSSTGTKKINKSFDWKPKVKLIEGLKKTIKSYA